MGLFEPSESNVFEFDGHAFVMNLQGDGPFVELALLGVVGEFGGEFAVDEELEVISASDDPDLIPLARANV